MKTQKIISALALTLAIGAAAPALADYSGRFPGLEVERMTIEKQELYGAQHVEPVTEEPTFRFPGLAVQHLTEKLEDFQGDQKVEPVTTDAPIHG